ncbi:MAG TPA: bifunctional diguanylate cyclase/phosphodiesterase [Solirubrobacteraceae bacterium]|nr:bifunctional diguanylate cyclase/phosphodiesterase [Solirubrobacteraceae bacterium]
MPVSTASSAPSRRGPVLGRPGLLVAGALAVIVAMAWLGIASSEKADRARELQVVTQHLRGEGLRVEGLTWGAVATGGGDRISASRAAASGFAIHHRLLDDLRRLRSLGAPPELLAPIERDLGRMADAGLAANSTYLTDMAGARRIVERRFGPAIKRFVASVDRAAAAQGHRAEEAQRRAVVGSAGTLVAGVLVLGLLGFLGHRIRRTAAVDARSREHERRAENRIRALVRHSSDVVAITGADGRIGWIAEPVRALLGRDPDALAGTPVAALVHPDDAGRLETLLAAATSGPGRPAPVTVRLVDADGAPRSVEVVADDLRADPDVAGVLLNLRDVTERQALQEQLRHEAFHDRLTGLPNRALFDDRLGRALARARRHGLEAALVYVDLDDFKSINDGLGHAGGDALLRATAERLTQAVRVEDTAARMGGDEFAVLVEDVRDQAEVLEMANRIGAALAEPVLIEGQRVVSTASIGVAALAAGADAETARVDADLALYEAKRQGRARVVSFTGSMRQDLDDRLELTADLERAIDAGELSLRFQPIVELGDGAVVSVEALLRWDHPRHGPIAPVRFVPLAEATGLIVPIGRWVLETACAQLAAWDATLPAARDLALNVNVSTPQLQEPGFAATVAAVLARTGIAPARLTLEITESVLLDDGDAVQGELRALKELGVRLALDDFGTGYSSLAYLQRFPVDVLKIDRSFVTGIADDPERAGLVNGIVEIGRTLDLDVVIEGIETPAEARLLRAMGSGHGQGYLFSRPVRADAVPQLLLHPLLDPVNL